ncbi:hypothetical protein Bca4012_032111 [Brassica carinata]
MSLAISNYHPYYALAMFYLSQPPTYSSILMGNVIFLDVEAIEFLFSTQMTFDGISGVNITTPGVDNSIHLLILLF